jgi:hypothetical protein
MKILPLKQKTVVKKYDKLNSHIDFSREKEKSSARKTPTQITCCRCKKRFILPFKPRNPEVYCDDCFNKR